MGGGRRGQRPTSNANESPGCVAGCLGSLFVGGLVGLGAERLLGTDAGYVVGGFLALFLFTAYAVVSSRPSGSAILWSRFANLDGMTGREFELFMADIFRAAGYKSEVVGSSGDQGVDILLEGRDRRIAVQCKKYAKPVGNKAIQEVFAGAKYHGADEAWVVASNGYTRGARQLAERVGVILFDRDGISELIRQTTDQGTDARPNGPANQG